MSRADYARHLLRGWSKRPAVRNCTIHVLENGFVSFPGFFENGGEMENVIINSERYAPRKLTRWQHLRKVFAP